MEPTEKEIGPRELAELRAAAHKAAEGCAKRMKRQYYHEHVTNYAMMDAHSNPLSEDNDPLLDALKQGKR